MPKPAREEPAAAANASPQPAHELPQHNVAARLTQAALTRPTACAVMVQRAARGGRFQYDSFTFQQLDDRSTQIAAGLLAMGLVPGDRMSLFVRPSFEFIAIVFGLLKAGIVGVLIDPGMGRKNLLGCLKTVNPKGFIAISLVQAICLYHKRHFPEARFRVTVGRRWFWKGETLSSLCRLGMGRPFQMHNAHPNDPAAIIFTTGSTGPPKGVLYRYGNFWHQVQQLQERYQIGPGDLDVAGFPLFGLFNAALGAATLVPLLDASRPASVDPRAFVAALIDSQATQSFGSPAIWNKVGPYCIEHGLTLPHLRRVLAAGAPVPARILSQIQALLPNGAMHTPYGATEALPVASIAAPEVLQETAATTADGGGVCVGRRFSGIEWRVIRIADGPIASLDDVTCLPTGQIGELIVKGPVVTQAYWAHPSANALGKIADGDTFWHRMGDAGYLDAQDRFWFCGRKTHRVTTPQGDLFTIPCEAIFNQHPHVFRSALVGVGPPGQQQPVLIVEPWPEHFPKTPSAMNRLMKQLEERGQAHCKTQAIRRYLVHPSFPVDIRHNAKIFREKLAVWAAQHPT